MRRALVRAALAAVVLGAASLAGGRVAAAAAPDDEVAKGEVELRAAEADGSEIDKRNKAASAITHFEAAYEEKPSWRAAAGASDANLLLGSSAVASSWYWLASDEADYSEAYLTWQKTALSRVFDNRAAFTFEYSESPAAMRIDGVALPPKGIERPVALDVGRHVIVAGSTNGNSYQGEIDVTPDQIGARQFFHIKFEHILKAGEADPNGTTVGPREKKSGGGMSTLKIVTVVATVALASAIAVGGGYLLFGRDNPRGLDTAEGAAVVISELVVIGAGTAVALLSD